LACINLTPTLSKREGAFQKRGSFSKEREFFKAADLRIKNYKYAVKMNDSQPNL
jgi:hypothetical protein